VSEIREAFITPNQWSRPRIRIEDYRAIVLHWFMNPGQLASSVVAYWDSRKDGEHGFGSAHYAIDDKEIVGAVPDDEVAYHVGSEHYSEFAERWLEGNPNFYTIGVELSHQDMTGRPTMDVWNTAVGLVAELCARYDIPISMIVTHFDVTGMRPHWNGIPCHPWFVRQAGEMARFRAEVKERI